MNFSILFLFFKVAETLISPFGEDEDDFEIEEFIERNVEVMLTIFKWVRLKALKHLFLWGKYNRIELKRSF